jgi:hypothetical protein
MDKVKRLERLTQLAAKVLNIFIEIISLNKQINF